MTKKSKLLSASDILGADDLAHERVDVPEWGGHVFVKTLTAGERDAFEASMFKGRGKDRVENLENLRARLCALTLCDEAGVRLFDAADVARLTAKSAKALDRVFDRAQRLNGMGAADIEEMVGNSGAAPGGATSSS